MPTPSTVNAIPMPVLGDAANIETAVQPAINAIDTLLVARFATVAARNAAITAPVPGQRAYCTDTLENYVYSAATSSWVGSTPRTKIKPATQIVNNSTTYVADDTLFMPLEGNSAYHVTLSVPLQSAPTPSFRWKYTTPSGSAGYYMAELRPQGLGTVQTYMKDWGSATDSADTTDGNLEYLLFKGDIVTTSAGNLQLYWSQFVATVALTQVYFFATIETTKFK